MKFLSYLLTIVLVFNLAGAQVAFGQTADAKRIEKIKKKIDYIGDKGKSTIVVKLFDKRIFKGKVTNVAENQFTIREKNDIESTISFDQVKSVNAPGLSTGAKTAIIASTAAAGVVVLVFLGSYLCWGGRC